MRTAFQHRLHPARLLVILALLLVPLLPGGQAPPAAAGPGRQLAPGASSGNDQAVLRVRDRGPVPRILPDRLDQPGQSGRALGWAVVATALAVLALGPAGRVRVPRRRSRHAPQAAPGPPWAPPRIQPA